ncbi:anthranilate synthase [Sinomonas atrocyanea]|uniref:Anthranilate synthase n=1 Tax=Sinomonas atrocyanea TaxID=37927 RepID=A0A127A3M0_9MICC|nr:hypothetical protein [Sinomonas atrocyanea]AMM34040.1 anthranilate synthase [Sinomonas atrocyanea]
MAPTFPARAPSVILLDGRSGAGKTSLAIELAAALREHRTVTLIHLEDVYPGWDGLAEGIARCADHVLGPLRRGEVARWRPWDWERGAGGPERVSEPADVVLLEGVGAGAAPLRALADAVVWVDAAADERRRRALARDGDLYAPHWGRWAAQEEAWLAHDDVPAAAAVTVASPAGTDRPEGLADRVLAALAGLPSLRGLLAPERSARESAAVVVRRLGAAPDPERLFRGLFGASTAAVWLDSSDAEATPRTPRPRPGTARSPRGTVSASWRTTAACSGGAWPTGGGAPTWCTVRQPMCRFQPTPTPRSSAGSTPNGATGRHPRCRGSSAGSPSGGWGTSATS